MWTLRVVSTSNEQERALRATADAHERRFSALTERSPIPTLLSEQGMRLAHVNDAFCTLVGLRAEQLLGTGWINTIHEDDLDGVIEQVAAALDGDEVETQARLVRDDGAVRTTVIRFSHLFTPGVGRRLRRHHRGHHRPAGLRGEARPPGQPRPADRAAQPHPAGPVRGRAVPPGAGGLACLFLDLDNFKVVNDSLGHTAGDELLVEVANRLRATVRPGDLVARFGGDEFVVVCENVDEDAVVALAGRVSEALARPMRLGGVDIRPYASVGVTVQTAEHAAAEELIRDCDIAMYQAKAGGKGRITVLDQQARAEARDKLRLVAELRDAIERREITLMYQPIFNSVDGHPVAVEALARWTHAERGAISPAPSCRWPRRAG